MIIGKYNYNRLSDFDQVCLCSILKNKVKNKKIASPVPLSKDMWEFDDNFDVKLNDNGRKFLSYCKKVDGAILPAKYHINYNSTFDALLKVSRKCSKKSNIEKFLYLADMSLEEAMTKDLIQKENENFKLSKIAKEIMFAKYMIEIHQVLSRENNENMITTNGDVEFFYVVKNQNDRSL